MSSKDKRRGVSLEPLDWAIAVEASDIAGITPSEWLINRVLTVELTPDDEIPSPLNTEEAEHIYVLVKEIAKEMDIITRPIAEDMSFSQMIYFTFLKAADDMKRDGRHDEFNEIMRKVTEGK